MAFLLVVFCVGPLSVRADVRLPEGSALIRAMEDELARSMEKLSLDDLPRPYLIQYVAEDRASTTFVATYGGVVEASEGRARSVRALVRVGSYELDNTNVGRGSGGRGALSLDDDYAAIRHSLWSVTDAAYKRAVEILARKKAYLRDKKIEDRPDDYSSAEPVRNIEPSVEMVFDAAAWRDRVKMLSSRFEKYPAIQDARAVFFAGSVNEYHVNSEGLRLRIADSGTYVRIDATLQADDGMRLHDSVDYLTLRVDQLPPMDEMLADIDEMGQRLSALAEAPILEQYTGPVLFEPLAAGHVFHALLSDGLCARPVPLGAGAGRTDVSLEKKLGLRILPRSFHVYDDPRQRELDGVPLAGSYTFDEEGVAPQRVSLVEKGILKTLLASRSPTKKIKHTTGHGRRSRFGNPSATVGCLYIEDEDGVSDEELREELKQTAREEGLEFGLLVRSMGQGGFGQLGTPRYAYKVYVDDGREELVRGLEFLQVPTRSLKRILSAGKEREISNFTRPTPSSVISPALLFEELELRKMQEEFDKRPILPSPVLRESTS